MNVLSLFDGISAGRLALDKLGIKIDNYFASEIDKYAIKVTQYNYPDTIQIGNVENVKSTDLPKIDLLIGGSPCTGFSFSGKMLNFQDPRSKLFFEYVRLFNEINPKNFLYENVIMKKDFSKIITDSLGVEPVLINSSLVSAQNRERYYWTNFKNVVQPVDKNIYFNSICDTPNGICSAIRGRKLNELGVRDDTRSDLPYTQCVESRKDNKGNCLTTVEKDNIVVDQFIKRENYKSVKYRNLNRQEYERLQTLPLGYTESVTEKIAKKLIGNSWTVDVIKHLLTFMN